MRTAPLLALAGLLWMATAIPSAAADTVSEEHEEGTLFVGHPLAERLGPPTDAYAGSDADVTTRRSYTFSVEDTQHWVDVAVRYDPGPLLRPGDCTRVTDLDLVLEGPTGVVRDLSGCDEGELVINEQSFAPGEYTVTVHADHGATVCGPDLDRNDVDCAIPRVAYTYDLHVWDPSR